VRHVAERRLRRQRARRHGALLDGLDHHCPTGNNASPLAQYHVHDVVFYKKGSGTAVTGNFDCAGQFYSMGSTTGLGTQWTDIVGSPYYRSLAPQNLGPFVSDLLFYDRKTGQGVFARLQERGVGSISSASNCRQTFAFKPGWTQIVWSAAGLLFYDRQTGQVVTGDFNGGACAFTTATVSGSRPATRPSP